MSMTSKVVAMSPEEISRRSKSNFLTSFVFLAKDRRRGLSAVYAFCRAVDDAVDEAPDAVEGQFELAFWRAELDRVEAGEPESAIGRALADTVRRFDVPVACLREVVDGVAMDLEPRRFATLEELDGYCHKVASAVGLACLPVFGASGAAARDYAMMLGLAFQLTNVLRDIRVDAHDDRIYLPVDRLAAHGVDPDWLDGTGPADCYASGGPMDSLVQELVAVARDRFAQASALLPEDQRKALLAAEVMAATYAEVCDLVAERGGHIDRPGKPRVSKARRVFLALRTWLRGRR